MGGQLIWNCLLPVVCLNQTRRLCIRYVQQSLIVISRLIRLHWCRSSCFHAQVKSVLCTELTSCRPVLPLLGSEALNMAAQQAWGTRVRLGSTTPVRSKMQAVQRGPRDILAHKSSVEDALRKSICQTQAKCTGTSVPTMDLEVKVVHSSNGGGEQPC